MRARVSVLLGPVPCQGCHQLVVWNGKRWRDPGLRNGSHVCKSGPATPCGAFMPQARERCARSLGHRNAHRSRYDMDNARLAKSRRAA